MNFNFIEFEGFGLVCGEKSFELSPLLLIVVFDRAYKKCAFLLVLLSDDGFFKSDGRFSDQLGLFESARRHQTHAAGTRVRREIVGASVSQADDLDPAVRSHDFCIPSVFSVVSHLVVSVLSEANRVLMNATADQEQVGANHEIGVSFVADDTLFNGCS